MKNTKIKKIIEAEKSRKAKQSFCNQYPNACLRYIEIPIGY